MPRPLIALFTILFAVPLYAAYSGRDLILPVTGRSVGGDGRLFDTALWITNLSPRHAAGVTLSFYQSGQTNLNPRTLHLRIGPNETWVADQMVPALAAGGSTGAIRVQSTQDVVASARSYHYRAGEPLTGSLAAVFAAIPAQFAIGNGEETSLHGVSPRDSRYKVYLVEVTGHPLSVTVSLVDARGRTVGEKRLYVDAHMQMAADVREMFGAAMPDHAVLRLAGMNGEGRVVAAGAQDASAYEMTLRTEPRNRMTAVEAMAYSLVALAVLVAVVWRKRAMKDER
jgi:hypothetical protein